MEEKAKTAKEAKAEELLNAITPMESKRMFLYILQCIENMQAPSKVKPASRRQKRNEHK
jgi:hypothetical protein